jgi:tRNA1Val (adenine37-N6)-methyltransferase
LANNYFQFKQFRIDQENAAMKVCTDSCIFGAWIQPREAKSILDIGTGTGLLSLMLAQRTKAMIDAVEIDEDAAIQAKENVAASPWKENIKIHAMSIQDFAKDNPKKYDLIISNPPFYSNSLKSEDEKINTAHHSISLSMEDLLETVHQMLHPEGQFIVLLPPYEAELLREEALNYQLYTSEIIKIKDNEKAKVLREVTVFGYVLDLPSVEDFIIKKENDYTNEFNELLKEYYLNL